jgi:hypothetical protein
LPDNLIPDDTVLVPWPLLALGDTPLISSPPDVPLTRPPHSFPRTILMPVQLEYAADLALPSSTDPSPVPSLHLNPAAWAPPLAADSSPTLIFPLEPRSPL